MIAKMFKRSLRISQAKKDIFCLIVFQKENWHVLDISVTYVYNNLHSQYKLLLFCVIDNKESFFYLCFICNESEEEVMYL